MNIISPVTHKGSATIVHRYPASLIVQLYAAHGIDVRRFFAGIETVDLFQCPDTGYRFFHPETIFGDDLFYQDLYEKIPDYYFVNRWEHGQAASLIPPGSDLLEVGCGDGHFLATVQGRCRSVKGLELNSKAIATARQRGLDVDPVFVQDFAQRQPAAYDVVCSFQVLEHIRDVHGFLRGMIACVKPGGLLVIAVPNNNPYLYRWDKQYFLNLPPHHAGLWNRASLSSLQQFFPLTLQQISTEPLNESKRWYKAQVAHYKEVQPLKGALMGLVPRQVYKPLLRLLKGRLEGKTIMAVYRVNNSHA